MEVALFIGFLLFLLIACLWLAWWVQEQRRKQLLEKYGDEKTVKSIIAREIWQGMSEQMLIDSRGRPVEIDERVYKSKEKRTYKYTRTGKNRFKSKIYLENTLVIGWDE